MEPILQYYKNIVNKPEPISLNNDILIVNKKNVQFRNKFNITNRTIEELFKKIDKEIYEWFINI